MTAEKREKKSAEWRRKHLSKNHKKEVQLFQRTFKKAVEKAIENLVVKNPSILKKGFGISYKKIKKITNDRKAI